MPALPHIHRSLSILPNGDVMLRTLSGAAQLFAPAQVRLYLDFDEQLRRTNTLDKSTTPIPGGYDDFQFIWNLDTTCQYRFSSHEPEIDTSGEPIPAELLLPVVQAANPVAPLGAGVSGDEAALFRRMLLNAAERDQRNQETARARFQERVANRGQKASKHMRAVAMQGPAGLVVGVNEAGPAAKRQRPASPPPTAASRTRTTPAGVPSSSGATPPNTTAAAAPASTPAGNETEDINMTDASATSSARPAAATKAAALPKKKN
ncbi:hypothetical protein BV20DRAFT_1058558 [Pilatotrama ljubarskyi]|nr:hypothetical protein BV20DRAFT_1058558 [Pilatotrama ljubarskyi]